MHLISLRDRPLIAEGDLFLWRRSHRLLSRAIAIFGRGLYSHAAMAARDLWGEPIVLEVISWHGGRARPLACYVEEEPGRIDWLRANAEDRWPEWEPDAAVARFRKLIGCLYGWHNLWNVGLLHLPFIRWFWFARPQTDDQVNGRHPPFCSEAVAIACRAGGVDPVRNLADRMTEPQDLARSLFFEYQGTLVP
jgi:hypothetical protein